MLVFSLLAAQQRKMCVSTKEEWLGGWDLIFFSVAVLVDMIVI